MERLTRLISLFMAAASTCQLYTKDHASADECIATILSILNDIFDEAGTLEMMIIEDDLIVNKNPVSEINLQGRTFIRRLKRKGISHIHLLKGLTHAELKNLVADISTAEEGLKPSPHVKVGIVNVPIGGFKVPQSGDFLKERYSDVQKDISAFTEEEIEKARDEFNRMSPYRQLHLAGFEEVVGHFVLMLKKEVNVMNLLRTPQPHTGHDDTHAINVSVLTIFQAQSIGIREELHGEIGLAAFLHDVGKLFIPREILERESTPQAKEKAVIELHPLYGAQYLAKIKGLTRLAPIVAFEHHLRYDGRGHPRRKWTNVKQHICSQMTAIADAFDSLRIATPHEKALDLKEVLTIMKTKDEGLFNPFLIDNFIRSLHLALSG